MQRKTTGHATIAAHKGAKIINDFDNHVIDASMVTLSPDAIVASLKVFGSDVDVKATYITTPASAVGEFWTITAEEGLIITELQLSAGTANYAI